MIRINRIERVGDSSQVAEARRAASQCSEALRLGSTAAGEAALLATELATNLIKHAGGGSILFGSDDDPHALTLTAIDKGEGIGSVNAALRDGYSTAGSPGTGLGAIARAATSLDIYTLPGKGTVVHCVIADDPARGAPQRPARGPEIGGICLPKSGETAFGDAWTAIVGPDAITIGLADGLGHGPAASLASATAVRIFTEHAALPLELLMEEANDALRPTRGAAVGVARIQPNLRRVDFSGAGNIAGTIADDEASRKTVSLPGIVGHEMRKVQIFSYPWSASSVLLLHSDGLSANWSTANYPGLLQRDPAVIAAVMYRDYCRGNDDATIVVAKVP